MKIKMRVTLALAELILLTVPLCAKLKPRYTGMASWYGISRQGRKMANGKPFDRRALTAASWYFPLGTIIHVINPANGRTVTVTVTDRGPNPHLHRIIDLSEAAAEQLGYVDQGLTQVFITPDAVVSVTSATFDGQLTEPQIN
jgi:rare lipoprotein A